MRAQPIFAELIFICPECKTEQRINIVTPRANKYNYECNCSAKFFINSMKFMVLYIPSRRNEESF